MTRVISTALSAAVLLCIASSAEANETERLLAEVMTSPGTRWVAVQSLPSVCNECLLNAPQWTELKRKYETDGLVTLVIAERSPTGCTDPIWKPTRLVCDQLRKHGPALGLRREGPTTLLWNWNGELLVERGDLRAVARKLKRLRDRERPHVVIDIRSSRRHSASSVQALRRSLERGVDAGHKFQPAKPKSAQRRLASLAGADFATRYRRAPKCTNRSATRADAMIGVELGKGEISLSLRSEEGCLLARTKQPFNIDRIAESAARALRELERAIVVAPAMPSSNAKSVIQATEDRGYRVEALSTKRGRAIGTYVERWLGTKFALHGTGADGINAAHLASYVLREVFAREVAADLKDLIKAGPEVAFDRHAPTESLEPGDLLFYVSYSYLPRHVAVYLGDGWMAHSTVVRGVVIDPVPTSLPNYLYLVARRPLSSAASH